MKKEIILLPFSANKEDIILYDQNFFRYLLRDLHSPEEKVVSIFKDFTGIKTKLKNWDLFAKSFNGNESITYYYRCFDNFIYDYKNLVPDLRIVNKNEVRDLFIELALSKYDITDLHKFEYI